MNAKVLVLSLLLCALLPGGAWASSQVLKGSVVLEGPHGELTGADRVTVILMNTGDRTLTDSAGLFRLHLRTRLQPGETVQLAISSDGDKWRIYSPLDGKLNLPADPDKQSIELRVLPTKSKRFLTEDGIENFFMAGVPKARLKATRTGETARVDTSRDIKDLAERSGLTVNEVKAAIKKWIDSVERRRDDTEKLALAAFGKGEFKQSSEIYNDLARRADQQLKQRMDELTALKQRAVHLHQYAGDSDYNIKDYKSALSHYGIALGLVSKNERPDCKSEQPDWVSLMLAKAVAHVAQAEIDQGEEISRNFEAAMAVYDELRDTCTRRDAPQEWARIQVSLGNALRSQGERAQKENALELLKASVWAYRGALEVHTREKAPREWAEAKNQLGSALLRQSERAEGKEALHLLQTAVDTYRAALEERTRGRWPRDWAVTQSNLADALLRQGMQEDALGPEFLWEEASQACLAALEVLTLEEWPLEWATTQNILGNVLRAQGEHSRSDEQSHLLLARAFEAYRVTLKVRTLERMPQQWAMLQSNLGNALRSLGNRTPLPQDARELFGQAVGFYQAALKLLTRDQVPHYWAITQNNLANALLSQSPLVGERETLRILAEAINAYQAALDGFGSKDTSLYWSPAHDAQVTARAALVETAVISGTPLEMERALRGVEEARATGVKTSINQRTLELLAALLSRRPENLPARVKALETLILDDPTLEGRHWFRHYKMRDLVYEDPRLAPFRSWLPFLIDAIDGGNRKDILFALDSARRQLPR